MGTHTNSKSLASVVAERFAHCVDAYEEEAEAQHQSASDFARLLRLWAVLKDDSAVLELGCGSGFLSEQLVKTRAHLEISDLSPLMVARCASRCGQHSRINYSVLDGEAIAGPPRYDAIVSAWTFQWFSDMPAAIERMKSALLPGGRICFSVPTAESFAGWRTACEQSAQPYSGQPLPRVEELRALADTVELRDYPIRTKGPLEFFRHLKRIGASCTHGKEKLSAAGWKSVFASWPQDGTPEIYRVAFVRIDCR